jgi:hypothetical protein
MKAIIALKFIAINPTMKRPVTIQKNEFFRER